MLGEVQLIPVPAAATVLNLNLIAWYMAHGTWCMVHGESLLGVLRVSCDHVPGLGVGIV